MTKETPKVYIERAAKLDKEGIKAVCGTEEEYTAYVNKKTPLSSKTDDAGHLLHDTKVVRVKDLKEAVERLEGDYELNEFLSVQDMLLLMKRIKYYFGEFK